MDVRMDRQIVIQSVATTPNEFGEAIETWTTVASPMCKVMEKGGGEGFKNDQEIDANRKEFWTRFRTDITTLHRIQYGGDIYDIEHIAEIGRRKYTAIMAVARQT